MTEKKKELKEESPVTRAEFDNLEAYVRRKLKDMSDNWKKFASCHLGAQATDGKLGSVRVSMLLVVLFSMAVYAATKVVDNWPGPEGANVKIQDVSGVGSLEVSGGEGDDARLILDADEGDDTADTWTIESEATGNDLSILNGTTERLNLTSAGVLTVAGGITAPLTATTLTISGALTANGTIVGDNNTTITAVSNVSMVAGSTLTIGTATIVPTSSTELTITETTVTLSGDIDIDGGDITCPADLLITPTGTEVHINGGLSVGDTTAVGDNNLKVVGTSDLVGVVTTSGDVDNDATGGNTSDPDFSVDGYAKFAGTAEFDGAVQADSTVTVAGNLTANGNIVGDNNTTITQVSNVSMVAGSTLTVGTATIVPTSATELTITENTVSVAGNLGVSGDVTAANLTTTTEAVAGNFSVGTNLTVTGTASCAGLTSSAYLIPGTSTAALSGATALSAAYSCHVIRSAATFTNTVANPTGAGQYMTIMNAAGTNMVFASSGNLAINGITNTPGEVILGENDVMVIQAISGTKWLGVALVTN